MTARSADARGRLSPVPAVAGRAATAPYVPRRPKISNRTKYTFPFVAVLAFAIVEYGRPQDWLPFLNAAHPGVIVLGMCMVALVLYPRARIPGLVKYMFVFLAFMALGIPFAYNNHYALMYTKDMALLLVAGVVPIAIFVDNFPKMRTFFRFWVLVQVPVTLYALTHHGRGVGSFLGDENDFCLLSNMAAPYSFFLLSVATSRLEKWFLGGTLALFITGSIASFSRGGFLGLLATGVFCWLRSPRKLVAAFVILLIAGVGFLYSSDKYWKEMGTIKTSTNRNDTGWERLYLWGIAWRMFLDHPIMGVGPGNYQYESFKYEDPREGWRGEHIWGKVAHSLYFTALSEGGIIGSVLYLGILVAGWRARVRIRKKYRQIMRSGVPPPPFRERLRTIYYLTLALDGSLIAFLVTGAFIAVLYYPHLWLLTAFTAVVQRIFQETAREAEQPDVTPPSVAAVAAS